MAITVLDLQAQVSANTQAAEAAIGRFAQSVTGLGPTTTAAAAAMGGAFGVLAATVLPGLIESIGSIATSAFDAAESYDKAFDSMRVATGAVGEDAAKLQGVFRDVFTSIPTTTAKAAEAVGFLSSRLKLTGTDLADLAKAEIELARITGADLNSQLRQTARLFKDFEVKEPVRALDELFKISQQTGTKITELATSLVAYGAPLRGLGFDFSTAATLIAKFQAEGVELGKVLPGLRQALANLAKEGVKDAGEAFQKLVQGIKDAPTQTEAVGLAIAAFGKRAGPDLAEAIRQGRFSIDELKKTVADSHETILKAAEDTNDFGESWTTMGNKITDALVPLGDKMRGFIADMVTGIQDLYKAYQENWGNIKSSVDQAIKDIGGFYTDHKTQIDALATAAGLALGVMVKVWAESATLILESISLITLGMRVAAGDWGAAWTQFNEMAKKEQEKSKKQADDMWSYIKEKATAFANGFFALLLKIYESTVDTWAKIKSGAKAAWDGIADSIIGPIKRAYDFLKGLDWREIFENLTMAARLGLKPGSPPQAARWILEIGDAALKAAAQAQKSVPQYADAFGGITAAASRHLPKIAGLFLELGSTVIKVLEDLKVKVPKVLDDIFGSVKSSSGKGSKAGKDAEDTGSSLGNMLVAGFGAALEGVKGIAAGQAQGGIIGRLQGTLSGALAGAQIGAMFGGGLGAAIGAGVGGIAGFFLSSPTELQKAQLAAQLQQAKDAVKLSQQSVLQAVEQVKQTWIETLDKARKLLESIAFYSKVPKLAFQQFFKDVGKLFDNMVELAKKWKIDATVNIKVAAENLSAGVALLSQLPAALDGISKYLGTPDASFAVFFAAAAKYFQKLEEFLETIPKSTAKAIGKFSNWLSSGVSLLGPLTDGLRGLLDLKDIPTDAQFGLVDQAIDKIITHIGELGGKFDKGMLKQMAFFSEKAGAALALWKDTVDAIKATIGIQALTDTDANNLVSGLTLFIDKLTAGLSKLDTGELTRLASIANTILPIAAALKAWADTSAAIRGYTLIAAETWDNIVIDFNKMISLMGVLIGQAMQFEAMAITLEDHLKNGAQHLTDGIAAMAAAVIETATALQTTAGHMQGGEGTMGTTSVGPGLGVGPRASSTITTQSSPVTVNIGDVYLDGNRAPAAQADEFATRLKARFRELQARAVGMGEQIPAFLTE